MNQPVPDVFLAELYCLR